MRKNLELLKFITVLFIVLTAFTIRQQITKSSENSSIPNETKILGLTNQPTVEILIDNLKSSFSDFLAMSTYSCTPTYNWPTFGPYVMKTLNNTLYFGISTGAPGNYDGAILAKYEDNLVNPVFNMEQQGQTRILVNPFTEQGILDIQIANGKLYIPGPDPSCTDDWTLGNIYIYTPGGSVVKYRNLPNVIHTLGLLVEGNDLYAATGAHIGDGKTWEGLVFKSSDEGKTWEKLSKPSDYRVWQIVRFNNLLYAVAVDTWNSPSLLKSADNGAIWQGVGSMGLFHYKPKLLVFNNNLVGVGGNLDRVVRIDSNDQISEHRLPGIRVSYNTWYHITATDGNYFYLITNDNRIVRTSDFNLWYEVANLPNETLVSLHFWPEKNWLLVGSSGEGAKIYKINLNNIDQLPEVPTPLPTFTPTPIPPPPTPTWYLPIPITPDPSADGKIELSSFGSVLIANPDGTNLQRFIDSSQIPPYAPRDGSWSIDGTLMAFAADRFDWYIRI